MRRVFGVILTLLGTAGALAVTAGYYMLLAYACGMATAGCKTPADRLFFRAVTSSDGWPYWAIIAICALLIWLGIWLFRHVPPAPLSPADRVDPPILGRRPE
ncbi:hypothetical protein [Paracoccus onubensis]|uniref:Uncharacterized protein n=1 Tax=Paracoccus onubensis TaxID=1675788 RepID=A0A418SPR3_9RHOB|nr:hypothetical protein [Paracoccus onubensis]RJE82960.1 hypothetical protein D3P04_18190 [Paracoccus onubensis]